MISETKEVSDPTQKQKCAERNLRSAFFIASMKSSLKMLILFVLGISSLLSAANAWAQQEPEFSVEKIKRWIVQLESPSFLIREQAKTMLRKAGPTAYSQLFRARNSSDLEVRLTIEQLISEIKIQWIGKGDSQQVIDLMLEFSDKRYQSSVGHC